MRAALSVMVVALSAGLAVAAECSATKGHGSGWSWREIEGRRCFYHGPRGMPKGALHWRHGGPDWPLPHHAGPAPRAPVAPPQAVPATMPAPALTEFELRYRGVPQDQERK